jgi:hypothetical protein
MLSLLILAYVAKKLNTVTYKLSINILQFCKYDSALFEAKNWFA